MSKAEPTGNMIPTTISGIPCYIDVDGCTVVKGSNTWDSDQDYYGYSDIDFTVYDRKGYKADWLAKKMTDEDVARIEKIILAPEPF